MPKNQYFCTRISPYFIWYRQKFSLNYRIKKVLFEI